MVYFYCWVCIGNYLVAVRRLVSDTTRCMGDLVVDCDFSAWTSITCLLIRRNVSDSMVFVAFYSFLKMFTVPTFESARLAR